MNSVGEFARWLGVGVMSCTLCVTAAGTASAQSYPVKPIRMIVPFPAGGGSDAMGRLVGDMLGERLGWRIVVENRSGAGGSIGADAVAKAAPDGYTLLLGSSGDQVHYPNMNPKAPYNPVRDFAPIARVGDVALVLVAHPSLPVKSVKELVALAKSRPGEINFSSAGYGASMHVAMELFISTTGVKMTHVPYKGGPQAVADTIAGNVQVGIHPMPFTLPFVNAGRLRALAVSTAKRSPVLADTPTMQEAGVKGYDMVLWTGVLAPVGTPKEIIARLHSGIVNLLGLPEVKEALARQGAEPASGTPEQFAGFIKAEFAKWSKVITDAKIVID